MLGSYARNETKGMGYPSDSYSPALHAALATTLAELTDAELLALVPDVKHKSAEGRALLAEELKKRVLPKQPKP